jgi:putative membrane protein
VYLDGSRLIMEFTRSTRSGSQWVGVYLRGTAMGVAEIIPGVSGGTIAFITGIYPELLGSIASFGPDSLRRLWRDGWRQFAAHHNLAFLLVLGLGMVTSFLLLAGLVTGLLHSHPDLVWAFFFGLIAASVIDLARDNTPAFLLTTGVAGLACGLLVALAAADPISADTAGFLIGGMLAVCAWLLPGISGGYVLLLLGLYPLVVAAIASMDLSVLLPLAAGCILGLALFARALAWLMRRFYYPAMALFTGFMAGSLPSLWPWHVRASAFDSKRLFELPVSPWTYAEVTGTEPAIAVAAIVAACGMAIVLLLARLRPDRRRPAVSKDARG